MNQRKRGRWFLVMATIMILAWLMPVISMADPQHKRGKDRDKRERKEEKFVNGHDARDGRWDGRGPKFKKSRGGRDDCDPCEDDNWRRRPRRRSRRW